MNQKIWQLAVSIIIIGTLLTSCVNFTASSTKETSPPLATTTPVFTQEPTRTSTPTPEPYIEINRANLDQIVLLQRLVIDNGPISEVKFSPDGKQAAVYYDHTNSIGLWDMESLVLTEMVNSSIENINNISYDTKDNLIVVGSNYDPLAVYLYALGDEGNRKEFIGHKEWVDAIAFSPKMGYVASGDRSGEIYIWDINQTTPLMKEKLAGRVNALAFSPDGNYLASGGADQKVKIWEISSGKMVFQISDPAKTVTYLGISADGKLLAAGYLNGMIGVWDLQNLKVINRFNAHTSADSYINEVAFSPNGEILISASADGTIKIWDWENGDNLRSLEDARIVFWGATFSPDGSMIAGWGFDNAVYIWGIPK